MPTLYDLLLTSTDWPHLIHAYGWATDTPAHLRALISDDPAARKTALSHLDSAIMHQGTAWTGTAPAALIVANLLSHPRLAAIDADCDANTTPLSGHLLSFLNDVANVAPNSGALPEELEKLAAAPTPALDQLIASQSAESKSESKSKDNDEADETENETDDEEEQEEENDDEKFEALFEDEKTANALYARAVLECGRGYPALLDKILPCLRSPHPLTRAHATETVATLAPQVTTSSELRAITTQLVEAARAATTPCERAAHILALGPLTPASVTAPWLDDPVPAVRICAALAHEQASYPAATRLLHDALAHHTAELEMWFTPLPPQFDMHARFYLLQALLARTTTLEEILPAALALIPRATKYTVDNEWGPLLVRAFPPGAAAQPLTPARREFLAALVANENLWDLRFGNPSKWFKAAALTYDRDACCQLLAL